MSQALFYQLQQHPFLRGLAVPMVQLLADCAELKTFAADERVMRQNDPADAFYFLLEGRVSLRVPLAHAVLPIETVAAPGVLGWSWLMPPYKWHYDAVAMVSTEVVMVHTDYLLSKMSEDKAFGCEMYARFMAVLVDRLHGSRIQMMDIYGSEQSSVHSSMPRVGS